MTHRRRLTVLLALAASLTLGLTAAFATGETTSEVSACATASTPAHTVAVDGGDVHTIPGDTATQCVTSTFTVPTETTTVPGPTTTVTSTVTNTVVPLFDGDFETGNLSQYDQFYVPTGASSYAQTVVAAPGGHSGKAARFETKANDSGPLGTTSVWDQIQVNSSEHIGDESFWHAEVYLPADFTDSDSFWQNILDWHNYAENSSTCSCPGSPPLTLQEIKGRYVVRIVKSADPSQSIYWDQYDLGPATRGAWTSFDLHIVWSDNPAVAVTDVSVNGASAAHITGHPNEFTGFYNYLLLGWYHHVATAPATQVVYLDNVRRCSSVCP